MVIIFSAPKTIMRQVLLFAILAMSGATHSQTGYDIVPRDINNGYRIGGGTITVTDRYETTGWGIPVVGEAPFTLSDTSTSAELFIQNAAITASTITILPHRRAGPESSLFIRTHELYPFSCLAEVAQQLT